MTQQDLLNLLFLAYTDDDSHKADLILQAYPEECSLLAEVINRTDTIAEFKNLFDVFGHKNKQNQEINRCIVKRI